MTGIEGILVRTARVGALAAAVVALTASSAPAAPEPDCQNDSKSLGRIELSTADTPGTWWYLTRTGLDAAGITDYLAAAEAAFGTDFADLDEAVAAMIAAVEPVDKNGNGYVCASALRGTRAVLGDPDFAYYYFAATDDKHDAG